MIETLLLASAISSCIERDARSFEELVANRGRAVVECVDRSYTEVSVIPSFSMDGNGNASVRFEFIDANSLTTEMHDIKPCRGFELGEDGIGDSLITEIRCNGKSVDLVLAPGALKLRSDGKELFAYPVSTRYVIVNEMIYELAQFDPND